MKPHINDTNIILALNNPDLSDIDQIWLTENKICEREDFSNNETIFLPGFIQVVTKQYNLQCLTRRILLSVKGELDERHNILTKKFTPFLHLHKKLKAIALGLNMKFFLEPTNDEFAAFNTKFFRNKSCPISDFFNSEDSRFGSYFSSDYKKFRLKLDIKPVRLKSAESTELIELNFNFHKELDKSFTPELGEELLAEWPQYLEHANEIINSIISKQ